MTRFIADTDLMVLQRDSSTHKITGEQVNKQIFHFIYGDDGTSSPFVLVDGDTLKGSLSMGDEHFITDLLTPINDGDAVNKKFVDDLEIEIIALIDGVEDKVDSNKDEIDNINTILGDIQTNSDGSEYIFVNPPVAGEAPVTGSFYGVDVDALVQVTNQFSLINIFYIHSVDKNGGATSWQSLTKGDFVELAKDTTNYGFFEINEDPIYNSDDDFIIISCEFKSGTGGYHENEVVRITSSKGGNITLEDAEKLFLSKFGDTVQGKLIIDDPSTTGTSSFEVLGNKPNSESRTAIFNFKHSEVVSEGSTAFYYGNTTDTNSVATKGSVTEIVNAADYVSNKGDFIYGNLFLSINENNNTTNGIKLYNSGQLNLLGVSSLRFHPDSEVGEICHKDIPVIKLEASEVSILKNLSLSFGKIVNVSVGIEDNDVVIVSQLNEAIAKAVEEIAVNGDVLTISKPLNFSSKIDIRENNVTRLTTNEEGQINCEKGIGTGFNVTNNLNGITELVGNTADSNDNRIKVRSDDTEGQTFTSVGVKGQILTSGGQDLPPYWETHPPGGLPSKGEAVLDGNLEVNGTIKVTGNLYAQNDLFVKSWIYKGVGTVIDTADLRIKLENDGGALHGGNTMCLSWSSKGVNKIADSTGKTGNSGAVLKNDGKGGTVWSDFPQDHKGKGYHNDEYVQGKFKISTDRGNYFIEPS